LIGIGGIVKAEDAVEFLLCGASAVQLGTANYVNPKATVEVLSGLRRYLLEHRLTRFKALVGKIKAPNRLRGVPQTVAG